MALAGDKCVFCQKKERANKDHLHKKHLKDGIYFLEKKQGKD